MNKVLKYLYVAIKHSEVVVFETNLSSFLNELREIEPELKSYSYYNRKFQSDHIISFVGKRRELYLLQKLKKPLTPPHIPFEADT